MPLPDPSLEPAIRDPKKLRNTAFLLVAIMLLGGWLVLKAYDMWSVGQTNDIRPAIIYRITPERDLRMLRQDGKTVDLLSEPDSVIAVNVLSVRDPAAAAESMEAMKQLAATRAGNPHFHLVTLVLDPQPSGKLLEVLKDTAAKYGMELPLWWVGGNVPEDLHKFIYNQLKANVYPYEKDGKWIYDSSVVLIDKNGHIRRAVIPQKQGGPPFVATFDFAQAAGWDAKGVKTGTDNTNTQQLQVLLNRTIDELLAEQIKPPNQTYTLAIVGLVLFGIVVLIVRQRMNQPKPFTHYP